MIVLVENYGLQVESYGF